MDEAISTARRLITAELAGDTGTTERELAEMSNPDLVVSALVQALAATFRSDDPDDPLKTWREHLLEADLNAS
jgi:hypothetical protein